MFMLRIRFDTFCTVPVIASSAPIRRAKRISQPPQPCRLLACASRAIGVISTSEKRPESLSSCRNRSLRRASRSCSSGRAPLIAPSSPRACAVAAFVRPRFGTALAQWHLAIVDPLLVTRLDAESLLGSAARLVVAPYAVGKRCHIGRGQPHQ